MDSNKLDTLINLKNSLSRDLSYQRYLLKSYEAQVERVEPLSEEFEDTVRGIFEAEDKIKDLAYKISAVNLSIGDLQDSY